MKYGIGFLAMLMVVAVYFSKPSRVVSPKPRPERASGQSAAVAKTPGQAPGVATGVAPERPSRVTQLQKNIDLLATKIEAEDQELKQRGFPKAFLDERLTETERAELLSRVATLNQLHIQLAQLRIQKVNLETEGQL